MRRTVIMWFRRDLRLKDLPALHAAASDGAPRVGVGLSDGGRGGDSAAPEGPGAGGSSAMLLRSFAFAELGRKMAGTAKKGCAPSPSLAPLSVAAAPSAANGEAATSARMRIDVARSLLARNR